MFNPATLSRNKIIAIVAISTPITAIYMLRVAGHTLNALLTLFV